MRNSFGTGLPHPRHRFRVRRGKRHGDIVVQIEREPAPETRKSSGIWSNLKDKISGLVGKKEKKDGDNT